MGIYLNPDNDGFQEALRSEIYVDKTELISLIRKKVPIEAGGTLYDKTTKDKIGKANKILVYSFWFYNKGGELLKRRKRRIKGEIENPVDPIDPIEIPYLRHR